MNRLIILGNGFDIAHGLKTKYSDFISSYWKKVNDTSHKDDFISFDVNGGYDLRNCNSLKDVVNYIGSSLNGILAKKSYSPNYFHNSNSIINIHNEFFSRINERYDNANWVDIEMEYFASLKRILNRPNKISKSDDEFETESLKKILCLNNEIAQISIAFENYLDQEVVPNITSHYNNRIEDLFDNDVLTDSGLTRFYDEFPKKFVEKSLKNEYQIKKSNFKEIRKFEETVILNFNYTNTAVQYIRNRNTTIINIHGELGNYKNPINLGFGDERDEYYSTIENYNQNEYLRFMKSFSYTKNNNYKNLFDFVESGDFQVHIMGHSCGLSDRTLLNAIFEHSNCKSIKVFFHEYNEKLANGEFDNHSEVVRNISRHFTQKTNMRDKIVNRVRCVQLPQWTN